MSNGPVDAETAMQFFHEWIAENQPRITTATLHALNRVDGVSEALIAPDVDDDTAKKQKIEGLWLASIAVLPEYIWEAFAIEFADKPPKIRENLCPTAEKAVREDPGKFVALLVERFRQGKSPVPRVPNLPTRR